MLTDVSGQSDTSVTKYEFPRRVTSLKRGGLSLQYVYLPSLPSELSMDPPRACFHLTIRTIMTTT
jgi:hypothetical protein